MCQVTTDELLKLQRLLEQEGVNERERVAAWIGVDGACYISPADVVLDEDEQ